MSNTLYDEQNYFDNFQLLIADMKYIAACNAQLSYLHKHGVPNGSVIYSNTTKVYHTKKKGRQVRHYTNEFLYISGTKYYIHKKYQYPSGSELSRKICQDSDLYDPKNPDVLLLLRDHLKLRGDIKYSLTQHMKSAQRLCYFLNANKSKALPRILFEDILKEVEINFTKSGEYQEVIAALDRKLGIEYGPIADTPELELKYCNFSNEIYNKHGERVRSKNELIATQCARECGLSYQLEPFYPENNRRADMLIYQGQQEIYLEILGRMEDESYQKRFQEKQEIARRHHLPLVAIDMTDYRDNTGKIATRLHYEKLKQIMQQISLGLLPKSVVTPY